MAKYSFNVTSDELIDLINLHSSDQDCIEQIVEDREDFYFDSTKECCQQLFMKGDLGYHEDFASIPYYKEGWLAAAITYVKQYSYGYEKTLF